MSVTSLVQTRVVPNGFHEHSYLIREIDDTDTFLESTDVVVFPELNLSKFLQFYDEHHDEHNIYIDSRLNGFVLYAFIKYTDDVIIFDPFVNKLKTVYYYIADVYHVQTVEFNEEQLKVFFKLQLLFTVYLPKIHLTATTNEIVAHIKHLYNSRSKNITIDSSINALGIPEQSNPNVQAVMELMQRIHESFSRSAFEDYSKNIICKEWEIERMTPYHVYQALCTLREREYHM